MTITDRNVAVLDGVKVETGFHAEARHGYVEAESVRQACIIRANEDPAWWNRPPCSDGRWRYAIRMHGGWGVWVLEPTDQPDVRLEVTAFVSTRRDYALRIQQEGQSAQKGVETARAAVCAG